MEIEIDSGLKLKLKDDNTASVINSPKAKGNVFIPQIVEHEKKKYKIISISEKAFNFSEIESVTFPNNSEVTTFEERCFYFTDIKRLQIPAKLKYLKDAWLCGNKKLTIIEISSKNKNFIYFNDQFLLGKSDEKSDTFDILHLARSDIEVAVIPPQIKIIKQQSFYSYDNLKTIIFPDNSEAKCVEDHAFYDTPIEKLKISANLEEIDPSNFSDLEKLNDIEVSPQNKVFHMISDKLLVRKSNPKSDSYDQLVFCYKNTEEIIIPSHIKEITCGAFHRCKILQSITFQLDSSLEILGSQSFIYCHNLKSIVLPEKVKKIGGQSFCNCKSLESIQFLGKYIEFDFCCLDGCEKLKVISFLNAIEINFIKRNSLEGIPKETKIIIPHNAKLIGPGIEQYRNQISYIEDEKNEDGFKREIEKLNSVISKMEDQSRKDHDKFLSENENLKKVIESLQNELADTKQKLEKANSIDLPNSQKGNKSEKIDEKSDTPPYNFFIDDKEEEFHEVIEKIGEGASSVAFKIIDSRNKQVMCKKVLKAEEKEEVFQKLKNSVKEFEALNHLHHPCICEALGFNMQEKVNSINNSNKKSQTKSHEDKDQSDEYDSDYDENDAKQSNEEKTTVALFMEYLPYKLKDVLEKNILNNTLKVRVAIEIAFGMSHIHSQCMMHRDLKIENIMLNYAYEAKIIDFDLVHIAEGNEEMSKSLTKGIGTLAYMSPEMSNEEEYDNKTDVYSYGIVLYVIFAGRLPKQNLKDKMTNKNPIRFPHSSASMTKYCIQLIKKCIEFNPNDRPTFDQIIEDMKNNSFGLAEEIDVNIIKERYSTLDAIRARNSQH